MSASKLKQIENKVTIKIPRTLYQRLSAIVKDSGFNSVTDFIVYVLRDLVADQSKPGLQEKEKPDNLTSEEIEAIRKRLQTLGYL